MELGYSEYDEAALIPIPTRLPKKIASATNARYIPILDGWRGVAILFVLIFHGAYNTHNFPYSSVILPSNVIGKLGALGVLIFFSISGYLITKKLYEETPAQSAISLRAFFIKRIFRILPPLLVYFAVLVGLSLMGYITLIRGDWAAPFFSRTTFLVLGTPHTSGRYPSKSTFTCSGHYVSWSLAGGDRSVL